MQRYSNWEYFGGNNRAPCNSINLTFYWPAIPSTNFINWTKYSKQKAWICANSLAYFFLMSVTNKKVLQLCLLVLTQRNSNWDHCCGNNRAPCHFVNLPCHQPAIPSTNLINWTRPKYDKPFYGYHGCHIVIS